MTDPGRDSGTESGTEDLEGAYALKTPEDNAAYYRAFAETYDEGFVAAMGYVYPRRVAEIFLAEAEAGDVPVLDIGAGTGQVAEALAGALPGLHVDGIDISAEMLAKAAAKGLYRNRIVADLTKPLPVADAAYGGLVSAGTFTHGHVGPGCLGELLRVARPGALFCLGIRLELYEGAGFSAAFADMVRERRITALNYKQIPVYEGVAHSHAGDMCVVTWFRKI